MRPSLCCLLGLALWAGGCDNSAPTAPSVKTPPAKVVPEKPKTIIRDEDLTPKTVVSVSGGFSMTLPAGWFGTDVTDDALAKSAEKVGKVNTALAKTIQEQGGQLGKVGGTILGFEARPSQVKYGYGRNLSGFVQDLKTLDQMRADAAKLGNPIESNKYTTPLGTIYRIVSEQPVVAPSGHPFKVTHYVYVVVRPKSKQAHAFRFSCVSEDAQAMEPHFKKALESVEFLR
jgi:hypothetical protein